MQFHFGDLTVLKKWMGAGGNSTRGLFAGGYTPSFVDTIDYITIATRETLLILEI